MPRYGPNTQVPCSRPYSLIPLGKRSLPSCLGGGDLDGDIFNLITLPALHPPRTVAPAAYTPAPLKTLHRKCTIDDIADFVVDFINSDILGLISKRHRILADQSDLGVEDPDCLYLAELHSKASDFVKSGTPVDFKELPRLLFPQKPDWSAGEYVGDKTHFYTSEKALGQLFRAIRLGDTPVLHSNERWITRPMGVAFWNSANAIARRWRDPISNILCPLLQKYIFCFPTSKLDEAGLDRFLAYRTELRSICAMHALSPHAKELSEAEIFIDTNLHTANKCVPFVLYSSRLIDLASAVGTNAVMKYMRQWRL
jgi:RNA-dependent RNA polymerase